MNKRVLDELNMQIKHEMESYYIYLSMAAWLESNSYDGMANWMRIQAHEEMEHAMRIFNHILERGEKVTLVDLKQLKIEWGSVKEIFVDAYAHEQFITGRINECMAAIREEKEYASEAMISWFVEEQVEEEANSSKIVDQLKMIGSEGKGLYMLDKELGSRTWPAISPMNPALGNAAD